MFKAYKYRIYPNVEQKIFFAKTFGSQLCSICGYKNFDIKNLAIR